MSSNTASPHDRQRNPRLSPRHPTRQRRAPSPRPIELDLARIESLWQNRLEHAAGGLAVSA